MTPPVAIILIQSAPYLMSRRTAGPTSSTLSAMFGRRGSAWSGASTSASPCPPLSERKFPAETIRGPSNDSLVDQVTERQLTVAQIGFARVPQRSEAVRDPYLQVVIPPAAPSAEDICRPAVGDSSLRFPRMCAWQSMNPGSSVTSPRSITCAPAGTAPEIARTRSPSMTITGFACICPERTSRRNAPL